MWLLKLNQIPSFKKSLGGRCGLIGGMRRNIWVGYLCKKK